MEQFTVTFTIASDEDPSEILDQVIAMCEDLEAGDVPEESVCVTTNRGPVFPWAQGE